MLYLLWNADLTGTSAPAPGDVTGLAAALRADFAAVEAQFTVQDDPTGAIAKSLVTLVYGSDAADFLFGLVNGTYTTTVPYSTPPGQPGLPAAVVAAAGGQLSYSGLNEQLSYAGVLDAATQAAIDAAAASDTALQAAVAQLAAASQQAVTQFLATYPDLKAGYDAYLSTAGSPAVKRTAMLAALLPPLTASRKQEQALATVTAAAGADPSFASGLLTAAAVLHADGSATSAPASSDLTAVEQQGLSVRFFPGNDPDGPPGVTADATGVLAYGPALASQLPPGTNGGPAAGVWDGYLTAPQDGGYYIAVAADPGVAVTLVANGDAGSRQRHEQHVAEHAAGPAGGRPADPRHADRHRAADHPVGQLAGTRARLAADPRPVPVLRHAGHPARRHLHPVPQGGRAGGRAVADRGGDRLPRERPVTDGGRELAQRPGRDGHTRTRPPPPACATC